MKTFKQFMTEVIVVPFRKAPKKEPWKASGLPDAKDYRGPASKPKPEKKPEVLSRLKPMDPKSKEYKDWYKKEYTDKGLT